MSFNTNAPASAAKQQDTEKAAAAIRYLKQGWGAQAFLLLSEPGTEKEPAARFALGLCHLRAGELPAAISCFEQAQYLIKMAPSPQQGAAENSTTYLHLSAEQIDERTYLKPMDIDFCKRFPRTAEQTVLMALIHAYLKKGMAEQALRLASGLTGPMFESYKKELTERKDRPP